MIPVGPFQFKLFSDSVILWLLSLCVNCTGKCVFQVNMFKLEISELIT